MTPSTQRRKQASTGRRRKSSVEVLVSGGIDSAALLAFYLRQRFNVRALFVDFGQPAAKQESRAAKAVCNLRRIHAYNAVNLKNGYPLLEIRTPQEVQRSA